MPDFSVDRLKSLSAHEGLNTLERDQSVLTTQ